MTGATAQLRQLFVRPGRAGHPSLAQVQTSIHRKDLACDVPGAVKSDDGVGDVVRAGNPPQRNSRRHALPELVPARRPGCVHEAGGNRVHPNLGTEHRGEQPGQMIDPCFADGVGNRAAKRALPPERRDVHYVPVAAGPNVGDGGSRDVPRTEYVDLEDATPDLGRGPGQVVVRHLCCRAGVVHDEVELPVTLHGIFDELVRRTFVADIRLQVAAVKLVGEGLSLCGRRSRVDDNGHAGVTEPSGNCGPDPGRRAGHERDAGNAVHRLQVTGPTRTTA